MICKGCGCTFFRENGSRSFRGYCSKECNLRNPRIAKGCKPTCKETSVSVREVLFKNGLTHYQQVCSICSRTKFIRKSVAKKIQVESKAIKERSEILRRRYSESFYNSGPWLQIRFRALKKYGNKCMLCGAIDVQVHVDHINPRSKFPELALDLNNLQVLCSSCNLGEGASLGGDFRTNPINNRVIRKEENRE